MTKRHSIDRGPIGVIKVIEGDTLSGDELVRRYLCESRVEQATALLLSMNWDTHPRACMHSLNQIVNYLFKLPLTADREGDTVLHYFCATSIIR